MGFKREDLHGFTALDLKKLNDNFRNLWSKVFGNVDFTDLTSGVNRQIFTIPLQPQGEGNLDGSHPLEIRFYVPEDIRSIRKASLNARVSRYRMDSGITETKPQVTTSAIVTNGQSTVTTAKVDVWGDTLSGEYAYPPTQPITDPYNFGGDAQFNNMSNTFRWGQNTATGETVNAGAIAQVYEDGHVGTAAMVDMYLMQHEHDMRHTHEGTAEVTIEGHSHVLDEGIKESETAPSGVKIYINDSLVGTVMSEANNIQNNIDISEYVKIGDWNFIKITADTVARVTCFGIVELLQIN